MSHIRHHIRFAGLGLFLLTLGLSLSVSTANAQTGKITGVVTDAASGETLPGANVALIGTQRGASADLEGRFFILNVPPGTYSVRASMIGYGALLVEGVVVNINRTVTVDLPLSEEALQTGEIVVTAVRPDVEADQTATLEIIRPADMVATPGLVNLGDILSLQAEVSDGHFRGGRSNEELYMLSGMGIVNPLNSSRSFTPILSAVEEVEVITSGFSAEYGNAMSGVINISMKEGRDEWESRAEVRARAPSYKHWGGSVYDAANNPYIQDLDRLEAWLEPDPENPEVARWEGAVGRGLGGRIDSLTGPQVVYDLWKQSHREIGYEYDNRWDRQMDLTLGGPLSDRVNLFLAGQANEVWPMLPTVTPDLERQIMGNVVFVPTPGKKLKFMGAYSNNQGQEFTNSASGFYRWVYDRVIAANRVRDRSAQLGMQWSHVLNDLTFYELNLSTLRTNTREGVDVLDPDRFREDISDFAVWERLQWPDGFRTGVMDDDFLNEQSATYSLTGAITSQVTSGHQVKAGFQGNIFDIDVQNRINHTSPTAAQAEYYTATPVEGALYIQDKMEFEGMIANVGMRLDAYNTRSNYFVDEFSPYRDPDTPGSLNQDRAVTKSTSTVVRLQPRFGFSFPVSSSAVFHLNYGSYLKRPSLEYLIQSRTTLFNDALGTVEPIRLGNPTLEPEETKSYDVGLVLGIADGFTLDLSGYFKDVKNLVERVIYRDKDGNQYETLANRDYADIRGFNVRLNKRSGFITGSLRYHFGVATGKSSTPFDASPILDEQGEQTRLPSPRDIFLNYDRRHSVIVSSGFNTDANWGPSIGSFQPLSNFTFSVLHSTRSGRPYSSFADFSDPLARKNTQRSPWEHNTDLKATKVLTLAGSNTRLFVEVYNLFNLKIYQYSRVFDDAENLRKYEQDPDNLEFLTNERGYTANQSFRIFGNAPRSVQIGFLLDI